MIEALNPVRITDVNDPLLSKWKEIYEISFPPAELRSWEDHLSKLANPLFHCEAYLREELLVGILVYWDLPDFCYIEYIAISPEVRQEGYGSKLIRQFMAWYDLDAQKTLGQYKPITLEMDIITDSVSQLRWAFYERLGFAKHNKVHNHPPYQPGFPPHPVNILCAGQTLNEKQQDQFIYQIETTALGK